jgi:hypothetical protein
VASAVTAGVTAGAGAWYGARLKRRHETDAELRRVLDDAMPCLERGEQRARELRIAFREDGANTSEQTVESLAALLNELSRASQLRDRIAFRVEADEPLHAHYVAAVENLSEISNIMRLTEALPNKETHLWLEPQRMTQFDERMTQYHKDFRHEREEFVKAAQRRLKE